ncbi:cilia- and flagella-associated protein 300-like [Lycorma delicatula]|uniref:cilia- and flagella-associated protein 300-like n=1 Tax=Lycorma delicatula TaxID=130591 RepID=UPI003F5142AA
MDSSKFTFVHTRGKISEFLCNKSVKEYLMKWSIKGHISIQYYNFNEQFNAYQKQEFAEAFFKDSNVLSTLKKPNDGSNLIPVDEPLTNVKVESIPCTVLSLEFFDRILDDNNIIRGQSGDIIHCLEEEYDDYFIIGDKLRVENIPTPHGASILGNDGYRWSTNPPVQSHTRKRNIVLCLSGNVGQAKNITEKEAFAFITVIYYRQMLLDSNSDVYNLFSESERNQFLFRLLKFLCLGGQWCQYEDNINPYVDTVKLLYKDLLRVERVTGTEELVIRSIIIKVTATTKDGSKKIPENPNNPQNFLYLIIDPFTRRVTTFFHQWDGLFFV